VPYPGETRVVGIHGFGVSASVSPIVPGSSVTWSSSGGQFSPNPSPQQGYASGSTFKSDSVGSYDISADWQEQHSNGGTLVVVKSDLEADGVTEEHEETPGLFLAANSPRHRFQFHVEYPEGLQYKRVTFSIGDAPVEVWSDEEDGHRLDGEGGSGMIWDNIQPGDPAELGEGHNNWGDLPTQVWLKPTRPTTSGPATLQLTVTSWCYRFETEEHLTAGGDVDTVNLNVVGIDLSASGTDEASEEDPGAFVGVNNDDDDGDGVVDYEDANGVAGEDDLVPITLSISGPGPEGVVLSWTNGSKVGVYAGSDKSGPVSSGTHYAFNQLPKTLYVEGKQASGGMRDVTFALAYKEEGGTAKDIVNFTVVEVDLSAWDLHSEVPEQQEENPGVFIHFNVDNDNANVNGDQPIADYTEVGPVNGEDDTEALVAAVTPAGLEHGTLTLVRTNESAKVWKDAQKGAGNKVVVDVDSRVWDMSVAADRSDFNAVRTNLRAEGCGGGASGLALQYKDPNGALRTSDTVDYTFIAALCGRQPMPIERIWASGLYPDLIHCEWSITGQATNVYNCFAWSVDEQNHWYSPAEMDQVYGNANNLLDDEDLDRFYELKMSWERIAGGTDEDKASQAEATYYSYGAPWDYVNHPENPPGAGGHAARNATKLVPPCTCGAGQWVMYSSKLGQAVRIEHVWNQLNESSYGSPDIFYH
jgi:hypothetical protein